MIMICDEFLPIIIGQRLIDRNSISVNIHNIMRHNVEVSV